MRSKSQIEQKVSKFKDLEDLVEECDVLIQLGEEEEDDALIAELTEKLAIAKNSVKSIEVEKMLSGELDTANAIISINAGAGGTEAQDWAEMLLRMYLRFCERRNFKSELIEIQAGDEAGIKSATLTVSGEYAYGYLKAEAGIHRLVRISPYDSNKRRHTSFSSVYVFPEISGDVDIEINESDLRVDTYRASGAGGQHINKTDSAVRMTHIPTGIVVQCQSQRSQHKNRSTAMKILKSRIYELKMREEKEKMAQIGGEKKEIAWGSQIRSYVMQPYRLVKDHRTKYEDSNVDAVLDGKIDNFIEDYLMKS